MKRKSFIANSMPMLLTVVIFGVWLAGCTTIQPVAGPARSDAPDDVFTQSDFDRVLARHVDGRGRVDYKAIQSAPGDLESYYQRIATYSPDSHPQRFPDENHRLAYWINAYNAAAIMTVLNYYPIDSVLDVKTPPLLFFLSDKAGFFFFQRLIFGGKTTSLYYLENGVIRERFEDPRIHFALNCASIGCPRLPRMAFSGEQLDGQLDKETRLFLSETRNFNIDHDRRQIYLSSIFKWYKGDFTKWYGKRYPGTQGGLLDYIALYLPAERAEALKAVADDYALKFIPYDWGLNGR